MTTPATWSRCIPAAIALVAALVQGPSALADEPGHKALVREGARHWSAYCGSCHNARPAAELSPAEWDVVGMHMRVRANLPAHEAKALIEYLKSR